MIDNDKIMKITGHVLIKDELGNILVDDYNAINAETMSLSIAESLASQTTTGPVYQMVFGNGGASISGTGTVIYLAPNITGLNAALYNQTYQKIVNNQDPSNTEPTTNNLVVSHVSGNLFSDLIVNCTLDVGEPSGQQALDNATNLVQPYVFNELGLTSYAGLLLSHIIFSPIQKSSNRSFSIIYTIRFQLV